jgi:hypothetical protein
MPTHNPLTNDRPSTGSHSSDLAFGLASSGPVFWQCVCIDRALRSLFLDTRDYDYHLKLCYERYVV